MLSPLIPVVITQSTEPLFQVSQAEDNHLQTEAGCREDPYCLNTFGYELYKQGKLEQAIKIFRKAIQLQKNSIYNDRRKSIAIIYNNLGNAYRKSKKFTEAIQAHKEAIKYDSKYASAYNNLGYTLYLQNKKNPAAIANLRKAIELEPNNSNASTTYRTHLAKALRAQGKWHEANRVLRNAKNTSKNPHFYNDKGYQLYRTNKLDDAIKNYKKAIKLSPQAIFYNNLGNAYSAKKYFDKAIDAYRQAINIDSKNASAYNGLGYALKLKEKNDSNIETLENAIKNFKKALKLKPNFVIAKNNLKETERSLNLIRDPNLLVKNDKECLKSRQKEPLFDTYRSVVQIVADIRRGNNIGAGWVVKREGNTAWIVTNRHIVSDTETNTNNYSTKIKVRFFCKVTNKIIPEYDAQIVSPEKYDKSLDLAILKVDSTPDDIERLEKFSGIVSHNTPVSIIGHPNGNDWKRVTGKIKSHLPDENEIQILATLGRGNSGGPVLDEQNRVVGIIFEKTVNSDSSKSRLNEEYGFAYSIEILVKQLKNLGII